MRTLSSLVVLVSLVVLLAPPGLAKGGHGGVSFFAGTTEAALAKAKKQDKRVMVEVFATWCGPCKKQTKEVFDEKDGVILAKGMLPVRVDFDAKENQAFVKRYNVLSLPTILFLRPDGTEIGRVEGYDKKDEFLAAAEPLVRGDDALQAARSALAQKKMPLAVARKYRLTVAHAELVRGNTQTGLAGLTALGDTATSPTDEVAQEALFLKGRYFSRVKEDHQAGKDVWLSLFTKFPQGTYRLTALWWAGNDLVALHKSGEAVALLVEQANDAEALDLLVSFVEKHKVGTSRATQKIKASTLPAKDKAALLKRLAEVGAKS